MIEIYKDKKRKWRWRAVRKGRIVADGAQGYVRKANLLKSLESLRRGFQYDQIVDRS